MLVDVAVELFYHGLVISLKVRVGPESNAQLDHVLPFDNLVKSFRDLLEQGVVEELVADRYLLTLVQGLNQVVQTRVWECFLESRDLVFACCLELSEQRLGVDATSRWFGLHESENFTFGSVGVASDTGKVPLHHLSKHILLKLTIENKVKDGIFSFFQASKPRRIHWSRWRQTQN